MIHILNGKIRALYKKWFNSFLLLIEVITYSKHGKGLPTTIYSALKPSWNTYFRCSRFVVLHLSTGSREPRGKRGSAAATTATQTAFYLRTTSVVRSVWMNLIASLANCKRHTERQLSGSARSADSPWWILVRSLTCLESWFECWHSDAPFKAALSPSARHEPLRSTNCDIWPVMWLCLRAREQIECVILIGHRVVINHRTPTECMDY